MNSRLDANSYKAQKFNMPEFCSFCELENRVVITLARVSCAFIFQETCFWPALQIPIQRRGCVIHVHAFFCFKCDNAYRSARTVCAAMFNAVKPVDALMHRRFA